MIHNEITESAIEQFAIELLANIFNQRSNGIRNCSKNLNSSTEGTQQVTKLNLQS